jgi:uncharacterized protein YjbI with pentapeptide repeats
LTINLTHQALHGETINLDREKNLHALGPGLVLNDCTINSAVGAKGAVFAGVSMTGGIYHQSTTLKNFEFDRAHFDRVKFTGEYCGVTFGNYADAKLGSITGCDFSGAALDGCRFAHCNADTMVFGNWPSFVIVNPQRVHGQVRAMQWPGDLGLVMDIACDQDDAFTIVTIHLPSVNGVDGSMLPALRVQLSQIEGVRILG